MNHTTIQRFVMPAIESNMYVLAEGKEALVVDPNANEEFIDVFKELSVLDVTVLLTHEHYDHICGIDTLRNCFNTLVICSEACGKNMQNPSYNLAKFWDVLLMDKPAEVQKLGEQYSRPNYSSYADAFFTGKGLLKWRDHSISMVEAPGHSDGGSLIIIDDEMLFSGDNLVNGKAAICRFPGGNKKEYLTITKPMLDQMDNTMQVFPGHGKPALLGSLRQYCVPYSARS